MVAGTRNMYSLAYATASGVASRSTSSIYSDFPIVAPKAMAMGKPVMPVLGIPTARAFLYTFFDK